MTLVAVPNALGYSRLRELMLPVTLHRADLVVSMPKMKTHHLAGVTLALKNLFGVMPGICYGWPKDVLHHAGIPESILDIAATVRPHLAIVDGIIGMEGDGPIMGTPKASGVLVMGTNLPAVDATCPPDGHRPVARCLPRRCLGPARSHRRGPYHSTGRGHRAPRPALSASEPPQPRRPARLSRSAHLVRAYGRFVT